MARALGIVLLLAVLAAAGWILWPRAEIPAPDVRRSAAVPTEEARAPDGESGGLPPDQSSAHPGQPPRPGEIVPRASRDVTPRGVTPGPPVTGPLVRVPGPEKPPEQAAAPKPRLERLFKPVVESAGSLATTAGRLSIAEIEAPSRDARCGEGGSAWPCGRMARAELRRFIRGRAIECQVPPGAERLPENVRCSVGGADIGEWLVRQGWAKPAGEAYAEAAKEAEANRRGMWGNGKR